MSGAPARASAAATAISLGSLARSARLGRICLIPLFVALSYQLDWSLWRAAMARVLAALLQGTGAPAPFLGGDLFAYGGVTYQITVSCTALDVFFGVIPLLWQWSRPRASVVGLARFLVGLSAANLLRLYVGFVLHGHGVSWLLAHEVMAGIFYFAGLCWVVQHRARVLRAGDPISLRGS